MTVRKPRFMLQTQIDRIVAAAGRAGAYAAMVYHGGGITEIGVFRFGEWMGSFIHDKGLIALSADGRQCVRVRNSEAGMEWVLIPGPADRDSLGDSPTRS